MSLGENIEKLIETNVKLWHNATQIKKNGKPDHTLPSSKRVEIFYKIRELNAERSALRWKIDSELGSEAPNETKHGYFKG
jgi:hypothetical protein